MTSSLKSLQFLISLVLAGIVLLASSASVHAGADGPVVRGSTLEANATLSKVSLQGSAGTSQNGKGSAGYGPFSLSGSYGATTSALNAEMHAGVISIQSGEVTSSTLSTNAVASEVAVNGGALTAATILIGSPK